MGGAERGFDPRRSRTLPPRLSDALGIELAIDIAPTGKEPQLIGQHARLNALEAFDSDGCSVVVAAA